MSRLTALPCHTTSSFTFPKGPLISNKTLAERCHQPATAAILAPTTDGYTNEDMAQSHHSEIPLHSQSRRPSFGYQNSGFRESPSRPVHRSYRHFVVVIPPSRLIQEHGQLGHTLSSGPPHRLSQGIIMPLFPTMYGQLSAIAKEFNFPSTTGLCLYLQLNDDGLAMAPRISDESWHMLWNNLFDTPSVSRGPPIGGRIEFDIDFRQARWYSFWSSTSSQDPTERPTSRVPSLATSLFHAHRDSVNEDGFRDLENINFPLSRPRSTSVRHVPRKLSLVDRFEIPSGGPGQSDPGQLEAPVKALSPIAQEDEPKSARHQLDDRVRSWRASAIMDTTSPARSQADLESKNLPSRIALHDNMPINYEPELNIEDFTWSISSPGPEDYDVVSVGNYTNRLPSPDIANRMLDDSPPTPSIATTWGAPSYSLCSSPGYYRPTSLDLGFRNTFSRPLTPTTMTSWGPASPAVSVFDLYQEVPRPRSVHLGDRGAFSNPVTPTTATSWGAPLSYPPTPTTDYHVSTPDAAQRSFDHAQEIGTSHTGSVGGTWKFVWPYLKVVDIGTIKAMREQEYPNFSIYPPVYPNFDLYPAAAASANRQFDVARSQSEVTTSQYPQLDIYTTAHLHTTLYATPECSQLEGSITSNGAYPNLAIYPAVYPCFELYPRKAVDVVRYEPGSNLQIIVNFTSFYPNITIYPPAYPNLELYPALVVSKGGADSDMTSSSGPAVCIHQLIYSSVINKSTSQASEILASEINLQVYRYPIVRPYAPVYPHFELYPSMLGIQTGQPPVKQFILLPGGTGYPFFDLYPPLIGSVEAASSSQYSYPFFEIYPQLQFNPRAHGFRIAPQPTQVSSQNLTRVATTTATKICVNRRRKSHLELHEEVFRSNLVHDFSDAGAHVDSESARRPRSIKFLRDNRRIVMTRSPTGPAFHRPTMPPALPSPNDKAPAMSALSHNADSHPSNVFDDLNVHQMSTSSARRRSLMISSPSRTASTATQRALMVLPEVADSKNHSGSDFDLGVSHMALTGLSRSSSTCGGANLIRGTQYRDPYTVKCAAFSATQVNDLSR